LLWRAYVRRFDSEHTFRFLKQTLGWHTLRVRHPEQADRWTWLVLAAYTRLRLARALVADRRLPWERPHPPGRLTPNRVRRAVPALLLALGSPARVPQPCGRSPGRPKGHRSGPAPRHPASKKAACAHPQPRKPPPRRSAPSARLSSWLNHKVRRGQGEKGSAWGKLLLQHERKPALAGAHFRLPVEVP
jgi:hypothetical protein